VLKFGRLVRYGPRDRRMVEIHFAQMRDGGQGSDFEWLGP